MTLKFNRVLWLSRYMFVHNFIKLNVFSIQYTTAWWKFVKIIMRCQPITFFKKFHIHRKYKMIQWASSDKKNLKNLYISIYSE